MATKRKTKKQKEIVRPRHLAAIKGWRTRRANERKRSLAAKKGWRTRRKKLKGGDGGIIRKKKIKPPEQPFEPYTEISSLDYGEEE